MITLKNALSFVGNNWVDAIEEPLKGHPLASYIRNEWPQAIEVAAQASELKVKGSPGAGNWARVPWVTLMNPMITESATHGYYVVYLFHPTGKRVYLSLNQGVTDISEELGEKDAWSVLRNRANLIRLRLKKYSQTFPVQEIAFGSKQKLPLGYEAGHALGKCYELSHLPSQEELEFDLQTMVKAYRELIFAGGVDNSEDIRAASTSGEKTTISQRRVYTLHKKIERNGNYRQAVLRRHGSRCQACGALLQEKYGKLGEGVAEVHHLTPLSTLEEGLSYSYDVGKDFAVLCPNCHRVIHRMDDPSDLEGLKALLK